MSSTRHTAEEDHDVAAHDEAERAVKSSDAHDPRAKASWLSLLSFLSDDELARYGEIAKDQRDMEWAHAMAQRVSVGLAAVLLVGSGWVLGAGGSRGVAALLGLSGIACGYWPYRKAKVRRLWSGHIAAVAAETKRRESGGEPPAAVEVRDADVPAATAAAASNGNEPRHTRTVEESTDRADGTG